MWLLPPAGMCRKHLLGEHVEMHMFVGAIKKGKSIKGFLEKGLVNTLQISSRHETLAGEIINRGYNHKSPLEQPDVEEAWTINIKANAHELARRCPDCKSRMKKLATTGDKKQKELFSFLLNEN